MPVKQVQVPCNVYEVPVKITRYDNIKIVANSPEEATAKVRALYEGENAKTHVGMARFHSKFDSSELVLTDDPFEGYGCG